MSEKKGSEIKFEVVTENGKIVSRKVIDTIFEGENDLDALLEQINRQIEIYENTLSDLQDTLQQLHDERKALLRYKQKK